MKPRLPVHLCAAALFLWGCSGSDGGDESEMVPISGMYEVKGETVTKTTGDKRAIAGRIILAEGEGESYTATFHLNTSYPGAEENLPAEVIGKGEGRIEGRALHGTAEIQLVMATVPGVDPGFAFVPRMVSTRIVSRSNATVAADGTVQVELDNEPAPGETAYLPTRTTLSGVRVSGERVLDEVAAEPPPEE